MPLFGPPDIPKLLSRRDVHGLSKALAYKKDPLVRIAAAKALQQVGDSQATKSLTLALDDENELVRREVVIAIGAIADPETVPYLLRAEISGNQGDFEVLEEKWKRSLRPTINSLIIDALAKIGPAAVAPLCASLQDEKVRTRLRSAKVLGMIGDRRAVEPLISALQDADRSVRWEAVLALVKLKDPRAIHPLIQGLKKHEDMDKFSNALVTFGETAVDPLIVALEDENWVVSGAAARALGEIGSTKAIGPLIPLLSGKTMSAVSASDALLKIGPPAVGPLVSALKDENMKIGSVAYLLGKIGEKEATIPLTEILHHECENHLENENIRSEALQALGRIGDGRAVPALVEIAQEEKDSRVGRAAVKSLVEIGKPAVGPLVSLLQNPARQARQLACETLKAMGWEPDTDQTRLIYWLANREIYQFEHVNLHEVQDVLLACIEWELDWYVSGRLAQLLLSSGLGLAPSVRAWAVAEFESFLGQFANFLKSKLETPHDFPWIDEIEAKVLFGDYAALVSRASAFTETESGFAEKTYSYNKDFSLSALQKLCRIDSPVSSNLLHHLSQLSDLVTMAGVYEVEYDFDHPTGMASREGVLTFQKHRDTAAKELTRRGNPVYNPAIYRQLDCWRLPGKTEPA